LKTVSFILRLPKALADQITAEAKAQWVSRAAYIRRILAERKTK
jgi:hypothetical protein